MPIDQIEKLRQKNLNNTDNLIRNFIDNISNVKCCFCNKKMSFSCEEEASNFYLTCYHTEPNVSNIKYKYNYGIKFSLTYIGSLEEFVYIDDHKTSYMFEPNYETQIWKIKKNYYYTDKDYQTNWADNVKCITDIVPAFEKFLKWQIIK